MGRRETSICHDPRDTRPWIGEAQVRDGRRGWITTIAGGRSTPALAAVALGVAALLAAGHGDSASGAGAPDGRAVFQANCAGCHTLAAAGASGTVGPSLDKVKPSLARLRAKIPVGGSVMPAFARQLSSAQIEAVAKFVADAAGARPKTPRRAARSASPCAGTSRQGCRSGCRARTRWASAAASTSFGPRDACSRSRGR